jgi:hypothetical protein
LRRFQKPKVEQLRGAVTLVGVRARQQREAPNSGLDLLDQQMHRWGVPALEEEP